jgi:hypothetical protein
MVGITDTPLLIFAFSLITLWVATQVGAWIRRHREGNEPEHEDLNVVLGAVLTLLGLIIGFSFAMAISRYDQRKQYEEEEANAIGTEYLRVGLLPSGNAAKARDLLKAYLQQRILFYTARDPRQLEQIASATSQLQAEMWSAVEAPVTAQPTLPTFALASSGMNDVINSQGYTLAAWRNRIPSAGWGLMIVIAICSNLLVGYNARQTAAGIKRFFVLPLIFSVSFFFIADIDSPRGGLIRIQPVNLDGAIPQISTR